MEQRELNSKPYSQEWFEDGQIDEVAFCENFLQRMPLKCIGFTLEKVEREFYTCLLPDYLVLAGLLILFVLPPVRLEMSLIYP